MFENRIRNLVLTGILLVGVQGAFKAVAGPKVFHPHYECHVKILDSVAEDKDFKFRFATGIFYAEDFNIHYLKTVDGSRDSELRQVAWGQFVGNFTKNNRMNIALGFHQSDLAFESGWPLLPVSFKVKQDKDNEHSYLGKVPVPKEDSITGRISIALPDYIKSDPVFLRLFTTRWRKCNKMKWKKHDSGMIYIRHCDPVTSSAVFVLRPELRWQNVRVTLAADRPDDRSNDRIDLECRFIGRSRK